MIGQIQKTTEAQNEQIDQFENNLSKKFLSISKKVDQLQNIGPLK